MVEDPFILSVWILRIVLPFILIWVSFGPKLRWPWRHRHQHSRDTLLAHCRAVVTRNEPAPDVMSNLVLVDEATAPMLFQERSSGHRGDRGDRDRERGGDRRDREPKEGRRESRRKQVQSDDRRDRGFSPERDYDRGPDRAPDRGPDQGLDREPDRGPGQGPDQEPQFDRGPVPQDPPQHGGHMPSSDQMNVEAMVNFVAFSRRDQQRVFLPETEAPPPPPRRRPQEPPPEVPIAAVERANAEAQMVLRGLQRVGSRRSAVACALCSQLTDRGITISATTFETVIQVCVQAKDLQAASDNLMKMEAAGKIPSNELIDHVMDLYLERKQEGETSKDGAPPGPQDVPYIDAAFRDGLPLDVGPGPLGFGSYASAPARQDPDNLWPIPTGALAPSHPAFNIPGEYSLERTAMNGASLSANAQVFTPGGWGHAGGMPGGGTSLSAGAAIFTPGGGGPGGGSGGRAGKGDWLPPDANGWSPQGWDNALGSCAQPLPFSPGNGSPDDAPGDPHQDWAAPPPQQKEGGIRGIAIPQARAARNEEAKLSWKPKESKTESKESKSESAPTSSKPKDSKLEWKPKEKQAKD